MIGGIFSFASRLILAVKRSGLLGGRVRRRAKVPPPEIPLSQLSDAQFVRLAHELIAHRGPTGSEIVHHENALLRGRSTRDGLVLEMFYEAARSCDRPALNDPSMIQICGTRQVCSRAAWEQRLREVRQDGIRPAGAPRHSRFPFRSHDPVTVSAIASMYRGGAFIARFLDNITSQTIFADRCELLIVDANSPDNEIEVIRPYLERFSNIRYFRTPMEIGIYEAWNFAVQQSGGKYVTSVNLDDLRRSDSLELQAAALDNLPFADIVYQDFFYSFDAAATYEEIAAVDIKSRAPLVDRATIFEGNPPHNAPMWRRTLHQELGLFDASYRSAGDWDFWVRCALAGKKFFKLNDPHVTYFVNPQGLSTRADTKGIEEGNRLTRSYSKDVHSPNLTSSRDDFLRFIQLPLGENVEAAHSELARHDWRYAATQRALRQLSKEDREVETTTFWAERSIGAPETAR